VNRESHGNPRAQNPVSSAQGKYQFLDNSWRRGAGWNVYNRLRDAGMPRPQARRILARLHETPIKRWREEYQDAAFAFVILIPRGWRHWSGGHGCDRLVP
jgi:muramidase (phage lysozyme)